MDETRIEKTPKLGSLRESIAFAKGIAKETINYQRALTKESTVFILESLRKGNRVSNLVKDNIRTGEGLLSSPDIIFGRKQFWVIRYGPHMFKVSPSHNLPTGYTVFRDKNTPVQNIEECRKVCRLYRIWEEFYVHPIGLCRSKKLIEWSRSVQERIFEGVSERRLKDYVELEGSPEERGALKELDDEVYNFHETEIELTKLEERLIDIQFNIFQKPSEENIETLLQIITRFEELLPIQGQFLQRRTLAWKHYQHLLERKYRVRVNVEFNWADMGFAVLGDLMKYVLTNHVIPEATLTGIGWDITKSVAKAKMAVSILNLLVHYGGLKALQSQALALVKIQNKLKSYTQIWNTEIPTEMIRLPIVH